MEEKKKSKRKKERKKECRVGDIRKEERETFWVWGRKERRGKKEEKVGVFFFTLHFILSDFNSVQCILHPENTFFSADYTRSKS